MIVLTQTGVGSASNDDKAVYDSTGTGMLPIQAHGDGETTFQVMGRVAADAPWMEIVPEAADDFLQSIAWVPWLKLVITAGAGTVTLWIGEK